MVTKKKIEYNETAAAAAAAAKIEDVAKHAAHKVSEAAIAAAVILARASDTLKQHIDENGTRIKKLELSFDQLQSEVKAGNMDTKEVLDIIEGMKVFGKIATWFVGIGAAIATMFTAWHWLGK